MEYYMEKKLLDDYVCWMETLSGTLQTRRLSWCGPRRQPSLWWPPSLELPPKGGQLGPNFVDIFWLIKTELSKWAFIS